MRKSSHNSGNINLVLSIIICAWILCAYLMFRSAQLQSASAHIPDLCHTVFGASCDNVLISSLSRRMGYPLTGWGLAYFGLLGLLVSLRKPAGTRSALAIAAFGVGISGIQSTFLLRTGIACPLCLIIHLVNLLAFLALSRVYRQDYPDKVPGSLTWRSMIVPAIALFLGGLAEIGMLKYAVGPKSMANQGEIINRFQEETVVEIPPDPASTVLGSPGAAVQVVVFSSFQCPACKVFAHSVQSLSKEFGQNIGITFKNFPLGKSCNPRMSEDMQPRACQAAFAAFAAGQQKRFWDFHDQLFMSDLQADEKTLLAIARDIGLDMKLWESDRYSAATEEAIAADVALAYKIGINSTPSVFINGRRVRNPHTEILAFLIRQELNKPAR